ncbi:MAG: T9SS type A sorting domain-containing protein [Candidatus Latescibacteria bacterium]|nr:T9SS type A sorting domain-containing protein [Candidatus Latescibacterota bacterium]
MPTIAGHAIDFDGVDDFVQSAAPAGLPVGSASRTMEVWFKTDKDLALSTESGIVHYGTDTIANKFGLITSSNAPGKLYFWSNTIDLAGVTTLATDTWYHAAVTYDGNTINLYLNGLLESTRIGPLNTVTDADGLIVGKRSVVSLWDGQIDEVRIWDTVRTQTEIQADMNHRLSGNEAGLMTYLRFDEGSGTSTADDGPLDNTGALTNGPVWVTSTVPLVEAPLVGDADGDGVITVLDIIRVVRVIVFLDSGPTPGTDDYARFDANGDESLDVADAISIVNVVLNLLVKPQTDDLSGTVTVALGDAHQLPEGQNAISVSLTSDVATAGLQVMLNYDADLIRVGMPRLVDRLEGLDMVSNVAEGDIRLLIYSLSGESLPSNMGDLILIPVEPLRGTSSVDLSQAIVVDHRAQILPVTVVNGTVRVAATSEPADFALLGAQPNPFNPSTTISYELPVQSHITLSVYNLLGQEVIRLVDEMAQPGRYNVPWHGLNASGAPVASGIYMYRLTTSTGFTSTRRMMLLK